MSILEQKATKHACREDPNSPAALMRRVVDVGEDPDMFGAILRYVVDAGVEVRFAPTPPENYCCQGPFVSEGVEGLDRAFGLQIASVGRHFGAVIWNFSVVRCEVPWIDPEPTRWYRMKYWTRKLSVGKRGSGCTIPCDDRDFPPHVPADERLALHPSPASFNFPPDVPASERPPSVQAYVEDSTAFATVLRKVVDSGMNVSFTKRRPGKMRGLSFYAKPGGADAVRGLETVGGCIAVTCTYRKCTVSNLRVFRCDVHGPEGLVEWYLAEWRAMPCPPPSRL